MVIVIKRNKEFYMDGRLNAKLDEYRRLIRQDRDYVYIVDGKEGSGKSVFSMQIAKKLDPDFTVDNIVWSIEDFKNKIMTLPKYSAVMFDEAFRGFSSRATLSTINKKLIQLLMECRQRNLHIIMVLPSFFELERYPALHRSEILAHVYEKNGQRGYFCLFGNEQKKNLYILGKKFMSYSKPRAKFIGRFTNNYVVPEEDYRKKKEFSLREDKDESEQKIDKKFQRGLLERGKMLYQFIEVKGFTYKQAEELLGLNKTQIQYSLESYKKSITSNIKLEEEKLLKNKKVSKLLELEAVAEAERMTEKV